MPAPAESISESRRLRACHASVSVWTYSDNPLTSCHLGVDPAGGTNANAGVTWTSANTNSAWLQRTWAGVATANHITVFYKVSSPDTVKRNGYFDDASPRPGSPWLMAQRNGDSLTLAWPDCPSARLERADNLNPDHWITVTNEAWTVGGQKSVTLLPTESAGFYRLVLE